MPANGRRGQPQGKCHRKQTAPPLVRLASVACIQRWSRSNGGVRVKGWGKSPPRDRQRKRHGKPHREQDRIGTVRRETFGGGFQPTVRVGCVRHPATDAQDEWPPRSAAARRRGHTEPGLQASWHTLHEKSGNRMACRQRLRFRFRVFMDRIRATSRQPCFEGDHFSPCASGRASRQVWGSLEHEEVG